MRRALIITGVGLGGAVVWAIILGFSLLFGSDDPDDFVEQVTFRTQRVEATAGSATAVGHCSESKNNGVTRTHGTSYEVELTWPGRDGAPHSGVMSTCEPPAEGQQVTVWVSSRDAVYNRSPVGMYVTVPIAAVICAAVAWAATIPRKRGGQGSSSTRGGGMRRLRRKLRDGRLRRLQQARRRRQGGDAAEEP